MGVNKVIYGGETVVDLTEDTVTASTLAEGTTAHNAAGEQIVGVLPVYDILPIAHGGTGSSSGETGLKNLFAAGQTVLSSYQYGTALPSGALEGTVFFKLQS